MTSFFNAVSAVAVLLVLTVVGYCMGKLGWMGPAEKKSVVPNLIGRTLEEARADLEAVGLTLNQAQESNTDQQPAGKVFYQSIPVGTEVAQGTLIDIFISLGPSGGS